MAWKVGASSSLPIADDDTEWDGDAAKRELLDEGVGAAKRGCLVHDTERADDAVQAAFKLPFARKVGGSIKAVPAGLRNAASRLPQTDIPESVQAEARKVLDKYFERMKDDKDQIMATKLTGLRAALQTLLTLVAGTTPTQQNRDIGVTSIGGQVITLLDAWNMENGEDNWNKYHFLQDLYMDESGGMYCISISDGMLYRWPVNVNLDTNQVSLGEPAQVKPFFSDNSNGGSESDEQQQTQKRLHVRKRPDGRFEALAILSTAQLNKSGEIDSRELFDCFVRRFKGDGSEYINVYHIGHDVTRIGELRMIFREENVLIGHYLLDDTDIARAIGETLAADTEGKWGGSIEFWSDDEGELVEVAEDVYVRVFNTGTLFGYSIAPSAHGAAWGTLHMQLERTMTPASMKVIDDLFGDNQKAKEDFVALVDAANIRTKKPGVVTRTDDAIVAESSVATSETEVQQVATENGSTEVRAEGDYSEMDDDDTVSVSEGVGELQIGDETWDELVLAVTDAVIASDWGKGLISDHETIRSRLDAIDAQMETIQAALGAGDESATTEEDDEQVAAVIEQINTLTTEVAQLRSFYEANSSPAHRTLVVRRGVATPKSKTLATAAAARHQAQAEDEEDASGKRVPSSQSDQAPLPMNLRFRSKGLFQKAK